jgi:hypothetical protein
VSQRVKEQPLHFMFSALVSQCEQGQ